MSLILLGILASVGLAVFFLTWTAGSTGGNYVYYGGIYANMTNAKWFFFGASNTGTSINSYRYSTNGTTWTTGTLPASSKWGVVMYNGSRLVLAARAAQPNAAFYTDNGTTWTSVAFSQVGSATNTDGLYNGQAFIVVTNTATGAIHYSYDGTGWAYFDDTQGASAIAWDGSSRYIRTPSTSTATYRTTTSNPLVALNWANGTFPSAQAWTKISWGNGIWVAAVTNSTTYATSTDGISWTARTLPALIGNNAYSRIHFSMGRFYFFSHTANVVYVSADGVNWTSYATGITAGSLVNATAYADNGLDKMLINGFASNETGPGLQMAVGAP